MNKEHEVKVLDHGYVKLIDFMGSDETIIEAARMSTGKGFLGWGPKEDGKPGDEKLLNFLYRNRHMSPFEMCELVIEIQAPIMVFREWHRHRTFSYNEFSARYSEMPNTHYLPDTSRFEPKISSNKQESSINGSANTDRFINSLEVRELVRQEQNLIHSDYKEILAFGSPKEIARINTPVSRYSKMRAKGNLRNWLQFLLLRMADGAQWEIRQYANAVAEIVKTLWPRTYYLFEEYDLHAVHLSRTEAKELDGLYHASLAAEKGLRMKE